MYKIDGSQYDTKNGAAHSSGTNTHKNDRSICDFIAAIAFVNRHDWFMDLDLECNTIIRLLIYSIGLSSVKLVYYQKCRVNVSFNVVDVDAIELSTATTQFVFLPRFSLVAQASAWMCHRSRDNIAVENYSRQPAIRLF